jgi:hypothetical protein
VRHWLIPRPDVVDAFVVEDLTTKKITDFVSYYTLPSTIIGSEQYKLLKAAYCYYYVANSVNIKVCPMFPQLCLMSPERCRMFPERCRMFTQRC